MTKFERASFDCLTELVRSLALARISGVLTSGDTEIAAPFADRLRTVVFAVEALDKKRKDADKEMTKDSVKFIHEVIATEYADTKSSNAYEAMRYIELFAEKEYGMELLPPVETE